MIDTDAISRFLKQLYPDTEWKVYYNVDIYSMKSLTRISTTYDGQIYHADLDVTAWQTFRDDDKLRRIAEAADRIHKYSNITYRFKARHLKEIAEAGKEYTITGV